MNRRILTHIDTLLACHDSMTMKVLLPEPQSFHETEERGCHFEQVTWSSIILSTVRPTWEGWQCKHAKTQAWHNIPWSYMTFRHDFTTFFHSLLSSLSSDLVKGFYSTCHDVAWSGFIFQGAAVIKDSQLPFKALAKRLLNSAATFLKSISKPPSTYRIPRSRRLNFRSNWLTKKLPKNDGSLINGTMMSHEISHLQRKLLSRCWTEASWGNLHLVASVPGLAPTLWRCCFLVVNQSVPRIFNFRIFSESLNWPRVIMKEKKQGTWCSCAFDWEDCWGSCPSQSLQKLSPWDHTKGIHGFGRKNQTWKLSVTLQRGSQVTTP